MKIYIDSEFKCHTTNPDGTFQEVETDAFDGKCQTFIEGHCYELKEDGVSKYPWKLYSELDSAQHEYERQQLAEYESAFAEIEAALGVTE